MTPRELEAERLLRLVLDSGKIPHDTKLRIDIERWLVKQPRLWTKSDSKLHLVKKP